MKRPGLTTALAAALLVRLVPVLAADRMAGDVVRYHKVAEHVLDVSWNPYQAPRLYPYPPLWVWVEAGSGWLARHSSLSFGLLVKLPVVAADLAVVALLARLGRRRGLGLLPAWLYALHPVSVLVTGFHGQFDALPLAAVLASLLFHETGRYDASACSLALGIAWKPFPVLLVPLLALAVPGSPARRARFALLSTLPVAALLVPYALHDLPALRRELLGYAGVADFGWIGLVRGARWLATGVLARSEPAHWPALVPAGRVLFLAGYASLLAGLASSRLRWPPPDATLAVFLAFLSLYGAVSAQYLLWVVPFGLLKLSWHGLAYAFAATAALAGFYERLAPGVLGPAAAPVLSPGAAGALWVAGVAAVLATCWLWLARLVADGWGVPGSAVAVAPPAENRVG